MEILNVTHYRISKGNYKRALKKDEGIVEFLNFYHSSAISFEEILDRLKVIDTKNTNLYSKTDTIIYQTVIDNGGLLSLVIRFQYRQGLILQRYYNLNINNRELTFVNPLEYHYRIFRLLNFCLEKPFGCYNFEGQF
jgi:hypothetical protein